MLINNNFKLLKILTNTYASVNIRQLRQGNQLLRRDFYQKQTSTATAGNLYESNLQRIWRKLFGKYLFATNVLSSGVLMVVGDAAAQYIEIHNNAKKEFDYARVGRMFIVGALQGPLHHYVYKWMDKVMPVRNLQNTLKKILIDQIFMSPACILLFYYSACFLEQKDLKSTNQELIKKFPLIYAFDWMVWPGAQYLNFRYLETKYRVIFVNVCTALYNIFISYVKHDEGGGDYLKKKMHSSEFFKKIF